MDGAFKFVPKIYYQLYTIHAECGFGEQTQTK